MTYPVHRIATFVQQCSDESVVVGITVFYKVFYDLQVIDRDLRE